MSSLAALRRTTASYGEVATVHGVHYACAPSKYGAVSSLLWAVVCAGLAGLGGFLIHRVGCFSALQCLVHYMYLLAHHLSDVQGLAVQPGDDDPQHHGLPAQANILPGRHHLRTGRPRIRHGGPALGSGKEMGLIVFAFSALKLLCPCYVLVLQVKEFAQERLGRPVNISYQNESYSWQTALREHGLQPQAFLDDYYPNLKRGPEELFNVLVS